MADFATALLASLGARNTPENVRFVNAWIRAEGTRAAYNPLATTQGAPGASSFNSVGVRNYPNFQTGLDATVKTLNNGYYGPIVTGLRSGTASAQQLAQAVANSPWGTGSGVLRVLGSNGGGPITPPAAAPVPPATAVPSTPSAPTSTPNIAGALLTSLGQSPGAQLNSIMGAIASTPVASPMPSSASPMPTALSPPTATALPPGQGFTPGSPVPKSQLIEVQGEHPTAGLPGYLAHDYMAKAGSGVVAPVGGKIVRLSGHDPSGGPTSGVHGPFGWSLYLQGDDGRTYYMTHLGSRDVKPGQVVKAGQVLGTVGDYARWGGADHVHMGVH